MLPSSINANSKPKQTFGVLTPIPIAWSHFRTRSDIGRHVPYPLLSLNVHAANAAAIAMSMCSYPKLIETVAQPLLELSKVNLVTCHEADPVPSLSGTDDRNVTSRYGTG